MLQNFDVFTGIPRMILRSEVGKRLGYFLKSLKNAKSSSGERTCYLPLAKDLFHPLFFLKSTSLTHPDGVSKRNNDVFLARRLKIFAYYAGLLLFTTVVLV